MPHLYKPFMLIFKSHCRCWHYKCFFSHKLAQNNIYAIKFIHSIKHLDYSSHYGLGPWDQGPILHVYNFSVTFSAKKKKKIFDKWSHFSGVWRRRGVWLLPGVLSSQTWRFHFSKEGWVCGGAKNLPEPWEDASCAVRKGWIKGSENHPTYPASRLTRSLYLTPLIPDEFEEEEWCEEETNLIECLLYVWLGVLYLEPNVWQSYKVECMWSALHAVEWHLSIYHCFSTLAPLLGVPSWSLSLLLIAALQVSDPDSSWVNQVFFQGCSRT